MAVFPPGLRVRAQTDRVTVLVVASPKAYIANGRVTDRLLPAHPLSRQARQADRRPAAGRRNSTPDCRSGTATALSEVRGTGFAAVGNEPPPHLRRRLQDLRNYLIPLEMNK